MKRTVKVLVAIVLAALMNSCATQEQKMEKYREIVKRETSDKGVSIAGLKKAFPQAKPLDFVSTFESGDTWCLGDGIMLRGWYQPLPNKVKIKEEGKNNAIAKLTGTNVSNLTKRRMPIARDSIDNFLSNPSRVSLTHFISPTHFKKVEILTEEKAYKDVKGIPGIPSFSSR